MKHVKLSGGLLLSLLCAVAVSMVVGCYVYGPPPPPPPPPGRRWPQLAMTIIITRTRKCIFIPARVCTSGLAAAGGIRVLICRAGSCCMTV